MIRCTAWTTRALDKLVLSVAASHPYNGGRPAHGDRPPCGRLPGFPSRNAVPRCAACAAAHGGAASEDDSRKQRGCAMAGDISVVVFDVNETLPARLVR